MDVERGRAFERDAIVRIYSMTKPIVSVALMQLYEQGRFQLDDPVSRYVPGWDRLQVFAGGDRHEYRTRRPDRQMIVKDLLTHTSGLTYGFMHSHPVDALYRKQVSNDEPLETVVATARRATVAVLAGHTVAVRHVHRRGRLPGAGAFGKAAR